MRKVALILACIIGSGFLTEAAAASSILFGPKTYTRTTGQPYTSTETFSNCEPEAKYQLVVVNRQEEGYKRISSARVLLNGLEVLSPDELNLQVESIQKPVFLQVQNTLEIRLASGPTGQLTIFIECVANCFEVKISSPADLSTVNRSDVLVKGTTASSAEEIGLVVNSMVAQVNENQFAANKIPLGLGKNTIIASATNSCGQKAEAKISVQVDSTDQKTLLTAHPRNGTAPLSVDLRASAVLDRPVAQYEWDLNGDGTIDSSGPAMFEISTTYDQEGLYFPTVIITDDQQHRYAETAAVNALSMARINALILQRWNGMRTALQNKDADGAAAFFADSAKEMYRQNFTLMKEIMPQMAADLGTPRFVKFFGDGAFYELTSVRDGKEYSFHVEFIKDQDGLWKIRFF